MSWHPTHDDVERVLARLLDLEVATSPIEHGLRALAREQAQDDEDDDEGELIPLGDFTEQLRLQAATEAKRKAEEIHGSRAKLEALVRASHRRRRGA